MKYIIFIVAIIISYKVDCQYCDVGSIILINNTQIDSFINKLNGCKRIQGSITLYGEGINEIDEFGFIEEIKGSIIINNTRLDSIVAIFNKLKRVDSITIANNDNLIKVIDFELVNINEKVSITQNNKLETIKSFNQVKESKNLIEFSYLKRLNHLEVFNNLEIQKKSIELGVLESIEKVNSFSKIKNANNISFSSMRKLKTLPNFSSLIKVENLSLISLGLNNFKSFANIEFANIIGIYNCDSLKDFSGFDKLFFVNELQLNFPSQSAKRINGFNAIGSIGKKLQISTSKLEELDGFKNVSSINRIDITGNVNLKSISAFPNLYQVWDSLTIGFNFNLEKIEPFKNLAAPRHIIVYLNKSLKDIKCFDSIDSLLVEQVKIYNNEKLEICNAKGICDYLSDPNNSATIFENAAGCKSRQEINEICRKSVGLIDQESNFENVTLFPNPTSSIINVISKENSVNKIYDLYGRFIFKSKQNIIDINNLDNGLYIIETSFDDKKYLNKFLKVD